MPGSSRGSLGPMATENVVRQQNGSLTMVKQASKSNGNNNNNNNHSLRALGARGSVSSAWQDSRANLLQDTGPVTADQQQSRQMSAYRRWLSRNVANKVSSGGQPHKRGGGLEDKRFRPKYRETPGAAVILYLGIGMIVVGLVFTFVGLGDKVFHTLELQLIGPCLIAAGFVVCGIRILVCACADKCGYCDREITFGETDGRRQSTDASDDSWRPDSGKPLSASLVVRRPPTPVRISLERDLERATTSSSSSSFQDDSDPRDLLSLRSEDSSDYSLSEFREIELQKAPPPQPSTSEDLETGREGKKAWVDNKERDGRIREDVALGERTKKAEAAGGNLGGQRSIGQLKKTKTSDSLILNVATMLEDEERTRQKNPEVDSEHSWTMDTDAK